MITIRKLASLAPNTRRRKIVRLFEGWQRDGRLPEERYLAGVLDLLVQDHELPGEVREAARAVGEADGDAVGEADGESAAIRALETLRHLLMRHLGLEAGDWDLLAPAGIAAGARGAAVPAEALAAVGVYLESIRSAFNLGSIIRTAAAFGVVRVGVSADCPPLDHPRVARSAMGATRYVRVERADLGAFAARTAGPVIALELGGEPVGSFAFPRHGVLVLGSEELGLSPSAVRRADHRVAIPLPGAKASLNVGVACGIALAAWQQALR